MVVEEAVPYEEGIEPFDWEDYLYESWLGEKREKGKRKLAEAGA